MSKKRRLKPIADRVLGDSDPDLPPTERAELPTPGGLFLNGSPVVGSHLRTEYRREGKVDANGNAYTEERSIRTVVAVTVDGDRVPFDPDAWARWLKRRRTDMEGWA